jgi:hypothetical protein
MANNEGVDIIIKATDQYSKTITNIRAENELFGQGVKTLQKEISTLQKYMVSLKVNGFDTASNGFKILEDKLTALNTKLQETKNAAKGAEGAIGGTGANIKKSSQSWQSLSLVVQDLPYGFRGIQNNLPALVGSFAAATGPIYFGFSALIAITTAYEKEIVQLIYGIDAAAIANKKMNEAVAQNIGQAKSQIAVDQALLTIVNDTTKSTNERTRALNELKEKYKGNLELQALDITDGTKLVGVYNKISAALLRKARAAAYSTLIAEEEAKVFRLQNQEAEDVVKGLGFVKTSLGILSAGTTAFTASANVATSAFSNQAKEIGQAEKNIALYNEKLNENTELQILNNDAGTLDNNNPKKHPKNVISKSLENQAQEQFNFYKDNIFEAQKYFNELNNIQKINALMEATIRGASTDELLVIQQTYQQKALNFEKEHQSKLFEYMHQGQQLNKKLADDYNKEKLDGQVRYTNSYIKSLDAQLRAELRLHKGNINLQQESIKSKITQLKFAQVFAAGNVKATEQINAALLSLNSTLTGVGTNWANTANRIVTISNDFLANSFVSLGESIGKALAGEKVQPFVALANILADALTQLGQALISFAILQGAALEALKNPAAWPIALAAGTAAVAAGAFLKSKLKSNTDSNKSGSGPMRFANGGIISGPTMGLMGEYPGAASNPEVVAPLDKLKDMIGGGGGTFVLRGQDLLLSVNRAQKASNLKGQNISLA